MSIGLEMYQEEHEHLRLAHIRDEVSAYRMPLAVQGMAVAWYRFGRKGPDALLGFVQQARPGKPNVDLFVPANAFPYLDGVPHVSDPRLRLGREHAEFGAWDYTEDWKNQQSWKERVESRVRACERRLEEQAQGLEPLPAPAPERAAAAPGEPDEPAAVPEPPPWLTGEEAEETPRKRGRPAKAAAE